MFQVYVADTTRSPYLFSYQKQSGR